MAVLNYKDIKNLSEKERKSKLKDLKFELSKANVTANKQTAKTKEIKRAIARLFTFSTSEKKKEVLKTK